MICTEMTFFHQTHTNRTNAAGNCSEPQNEPHSDVSSLSGLLKHFLDETRVEYMYVDHSQVFMYQVDNFDTGIPLVIVSTLDILLVYENLALFT